MRVLAFLMVFFVLISPFYGIKKVKANPVAIGGSAIVALILSGLAAQGLISGEYKVTAAQLTQINDLAQAQLALEGATAVVAAQKLGDALAAGAESAKIKALATGGVIYAFLQAIQDVLFQHDTSVSMESLPDYNYIGNMSGCQIYVNAKDFPSDFALGLREHYDDTQFKQYITFPSLKVQGERWMNYEVYAYNTETNLYWAGALGWVTRNDRYKFCASGNACKVVDNKYAIIALLPNVPLNYYGTEAEKISDASSVTLPTILPSNISENITNWDGTSDLVLAPPLPYDVPDDESLVVDPTYGGEVIDPTDPVDPPAEEEGISLPWLSALLALLGLGKLTGIDEGVLSGIDSIVDGITSTIQDVIDGVKTTAGEWATAATAAITTAISGIQSGISSIADTISHAFDPPSKDIDWDKLKSSGSVIFTKFPFSIPADLKFLVGLLVSDPQAPKWTVTVPFSIVGDWAQDGEFVLDFSVIDGFMVIVRNIELLAFIFGMVFMTRQLIWK